MNREKTERSLESLHPASFGWALTCCGWDREKAEEVLQASYLKALEGRARFNGHSSMRTWFFGVVRKTAVEQRRHHGVRNAALMRWFEKRTAPLPAPTPETLSHDAEAHDRLQRMLLRLPPRQRETLHLVFYQELTIEDAAGVLGVAVGTARTHYERGKAQLRRLLSEAGESRCKTTTTSN